MSIQKTRQPGDPRLKYLAEIRHTCWLEEHEYDSLRQMQGSMNLASCPDPRAYERANYMLMLQGWPAAD